MYLWLLLGIGLVHVCMIYKSWLCHVVVTGFTVTCFVRYSIISILSRTKLNVIVCIPGSRLTVLSLVASWQINLSGIVLNDCMQLWTTVNLVYNNYSSKMWESLLVKRDIMKHEKTVTVLIGLDLLAFPSSVLINYYDNLIWYSLQRLLLLKFPLIQ